MIHHESEQAGVYATTRKSGFSLFEMVIVIGIIGALLAFIIPQINQYLKQSKIKTARNELLIIKTAIMNYDNDTGKYPTTLKDLVIRPQDPEISGKWSTGGYFQGKKQL